MKDKKKVVMLFSIAAIVVVGVGAGFWAWHEQPGFCATMCHNTMGSYLETYEQSNFLVHEHAQVDVACLDCHEAELSTQLEELQAQISGAYRQPFAKMETDDAFCLREGCHTRDQIVAATSDYTAGNDTKVNPHEITFSPEYGKTESPHSVPGSTIPCATCHTMHRESQGIDYCYDTCHHTKTFDACYGCHDHR